MSNPEQREIVLSALLGVLQDGCTATVFRNRRSEITIGSDGGNGESADVGECPCINMLDGGHTADYENAGLVNYDMRVSLDGFVTALSDDLLGPAVNSLYSEILLAVMADVSLGGVCMEVREEGFDIRVAPAKESARPFADFTLELVISFQTSDGNYND